MSTLPGILLTLKVVDSYYQLTEVSVDPWLHPLTSNDETDPLRLSVIFTMFLPLITLPMALLLLLQLQSEQNYTGSRFRGAVHLVCSEDSVTWYGPGHLCCPRGVASFHAYTVCSLPKLKITTVHDLLLVSFETMLSLISIDLFPVVPHEDSLHALFKKDCQRKYHP